MSLKVFVFSVQLLLIKTVLGQCISNMDYSYGIGNCNGFVGNSYGQLNPSLCANGQLPRPQLTIPDSSIAAVSSYGGSLNVQSSSPITPGSISVQSENQIQGPLSVYGSLPFLSAVAFEDSLPTHGSGAVTYQCGDGRVAILEENNLASGYDNFTPGSFDESYNFIGAGLGLARSGVNGLNNCVQANVCGQSGGYGSNCIKGSNCGYY